MEEDLALAPVMGSGFAARAGETARRYAPEWPLSSTLTFSSADSPS